jgi:ubiquitin-conjugating enzyme E2 G2
LETKEKMAATGAASRGLAQAAAKRLFHEYRELSQSDAIEGIVAGPVSDEDPFVWEALVL